MNKKVAVYAGMFDPLTVGHMWVIEEGLKLFDKIVVAVGANPDKDPLFSIEQRVLMLKEVCKEFDRVEVKNFKNEFLVEFAKKCDAQYILRSIRTESDYEYERVLHHINRDIRPDITTVFLMPPRGISEISSSMVKQPVGLEGWEKVVGKYVPKIVIKNLKEIDA